MPSWLTPRRTTARQTRRWQNDAQATADIINTIVNNLNLTAPAVAGSAGGLIATLAANQLRQTTPTSSFVATAETTASTSYTDLATSGPTVDVFTTTAALVFIRARTSNTSGGAVGRVSVAVSGATTIAAADARALVLESGNASDIHACGIMIPFGTGESGGALTEGVNTFTLKYRTTTGTQTFRNRGITVIGL